MDLRGALNPVTGVLTRAKRGVLETEEDRHMEGNRGKD